MNLHCFARGGRRTRRVAPVVAAPVKQEVIAAPIEEAIETPEIVEEVMTSGYIAPPVEESESLPEPFTTFESAVVTTTANQTFDAEPENIFPIGKKKKKK